MTHSNQQTENENFELMLYEVKYEEKLFELQLKRNAVKESEMKIQQLMLENQDLKRSLDKCQNETQEMSVQLEVAIAAVKKAEQERSSSRESMARQKIQSETSSSDRESLNKQVRTLEMEALELKRMLKQYEEKSMKLNTIVELCKHKENQLKESLEYLTHQIQNVEQNKEKLTEICMVTSAMSQNFNHQLSDKTQMINKLESVNDALKCQIFSFKAELEKMKQKNDLALVPEATEKLVLLQEWDQEQKDAKENLEVKEQEIAQLNSSLKRTYQRIKMLEGENNESQEQIRDLEGKLSKYAKTNSNEETKENHEDETVVPMQKNSINDSSCKIEEENKDTAIQEIENDVNKAPEAENNSMGI